MSEQVLSDKAFRFSPALLRKLASERWYHWGNEMLFYYGGSVDFPIYQRILGIQKIVLGQCLAADTLARLQNQELQAEPGTEPLTMAEALPGVDRRHLVGVRPGPRTTARPSPARRSAATSSAST